MAYYQPYQNQYFTQQLAQAYTPVQVPQPNVTPVQQPVPNAPQSGTNGLIWIQGEQAAKSYIVAPNTTVLLMDSEAYRFYIKSSDASGMPLPLRIFEYTEITQNGVKNHAESPVVDYSTFATKAEFDAFKTEINDILKTVPRQTVRRSEKREVEDDG